MNLREELLYYSGIEYDKNKVMHFLEHGCLFNNNLSEDLLHAKRAGILTTEDVQKIKKRLSREDIVKIFFEEYGPLIERELEKRIDLLEGILENPHLLKESDNSIEQLDDLREKKEKMRNMLC